MKWFFAHLLQNWKVAFKGILLVLFHLIHGIIPVKWTDHEYWNLNLCEEEERNGRLFR
jgi:hypothetical protein